MIKKGSVVKIISDNSNQQYVVLEIVLLKKHRAEIQALNTGLEFPPIKKVNVDELETVKVNTNDLLGVGVYIKTSDGDRVLGKVIEVNDKEVNLDMIIKEDGVETNVHLTIEDKEGIKHKGLLFVK